MADSHDDEQEQIDAQDQSAIPVKPTAAKKASTARKPVATKKSPGTKGKTSGKAPVKPGWPKKRTFPSVTLEEALKVAQAIKLKNGGHPFDTGLVASACGTTHKGDKFFYLASAANNYGLTVGSRTTPQIGLTDLG